MTKFKWDWEKFAVAIGIIAILFTVIMIIYVAFK